jgi:hypothetical protein
MIKRFLAWWRDDTVIGRAGVRINKHPHVSASGAIYWNVRDILFKPCSTNDAADERPRT